MQKLSTNTHKMNCSLILNNWDELNALEHALRFMPTDFYNDSIIKDIEFIRVRLFNLKEHKDGTFKTRFSKKITDNVERALMTYYYTTTRFMREDIQNAVLNLFGTK